MDREEMIEKLKAGESPIDVSIQKWKDVLSDKDNGKSADNCGLCFVYRKTSFIRCFECPIKIYTGSKNCKNTPLNKIIYKSNLTKNETFAYSIQMYLLLCNIKKKMENKMFLW